ncbi:MAG: GAF and ANTAR domain-containing protein [Actinomycetota bacterium]|nr:GAF and ANTAR domain-containing protein [Actinomycetota bacterium]
MADGVLAKLLAEHTVTDDVDPGELVRRLCDQAPDALDVAGAAVALHGAGQTGVVAASDDVARRLEELERTTNEGPGTDAVADHGAVAEPDLEHSSRWPLYGSEALAAGARAVFGLPLHADGVSLGALTLHRSESGELADVERAFGIAEALTRLLLVAPTRTHPSGSTSVLDDMGEDWTVHQASGMLSVQLGVLVDEALIRLRAHAFASERRPRDVATDIVARRLRFSTDGEADRS